MKAFLLIASLLLHAAPASAAQATAARAADETAAYFFLLGRHLEGEGRLDDAIAAHRRAIELEPASAELRAELAALYARHDRAADALAMAEAALKLDGANREANRIQGSIYAAFAAQPQPIRRGDDPSQYAARAIASLEKARGEVPDLSVEFTLGRLHLAAKAFDAAIPPLRRVVEEQPGYGEAAMLLAAAYEGAGRTDEAIKTLERSVEENPRSFRALIRLAELYYDHGRAADAASAYATAQTLNPRADLSTRRAAALVGAGDPAQAVTLLEATVKKGGRTEPAVLHLLAHALQAKGDHAAAAAVLRDLIARDPQDANALNSLGYMFADRGERLDEAIDLVQRALRIEPANPSFLDSLGWAYFRQGKLDLADKPLADAAAQQPASSVILDHLGDLRFRQNRLEDAARAWERALAGDGVSVDRAVIMKKLQDARVRIRRD